MRTQLRELQSDHGDIPVMEHYWHNLPGPQWFSASRIYADQVKRADDGAVFV